MESCDPDDFLTALVVTLVGAATSLYLSALDFNKPATVSVCCEVKRLGTVGNSWEQSGRKPSERSLGRSAVMCWSTSDAAP